MACTYSATTKIEGDSRIFALAVENSANRREGSGSVIKKYRIHSFPVRLQNSGKLPCLHNGYAAAGIEAKIVQLSQFGHFVLCW